MVENNVKAVKKKSYWIKYILMFLLIALILCFVISILPGDVKATGTSPTIDQTTIRFIYTGRLLPNQISNIERLSILNYDDLIAQQELYFSKYGFYNYYIRTRARQLFGK